MLLELLITVWRQPQGQEGEIVPSFSAGMTSKYPMKKSNGGTLDLWNLL